MLANFTLAYFEIAGVERMVAETEAMLVQLRAGVPVPPLAGPQGDVLVTERALTERFDLAARLARCRRNIDDILLVDIPVGTQQWALDYIYRPTETGLAYKCEGKSPGRITYLNMEVRKRGGLAETVFFDKREDMLTKGMISSMQRFPDNVLTGDAYGFALGMHCKDMENALLAIRAPHADGTPVAAPMLELTRCLMNLARAELGGDVDHTDTSRLAARANRIDFEDLVVRGGPDGGHSEPADHGRGRGD